MTATGSEDRARRWYIVVDGQRLRELRCQRGLRQRELAELAGVSTYTVAKLERHQAVSCRTRTLARLAAALGEKPSAILPGVDQRTD